MPCPDYELVARVGKTRGLEGEVTATAVGDLPFSVYEGLRVNVVPPSLYGKRELTVFSVERGSGSTYRLSFEEVADIEDAEPIAGRYLLACAQDLADAAEGLPSLEIGRRVVDERFGELGEIVELIETPANDVWVVDGARGEVLVPVIDEVVVEYPEDEGRPIRTHVMDGLVEP